MTGEATTKVLSDSPDRDLPERAASNGGDAVFAGASGMSTRSRSTVVHELPEDPVIVIRPSRGWMSLGLVEVWSYRELLYFLTWRDVKVRYKQTLLGASWAVLQPLMTMLIFTLFFGRLAKVPSDGIPYPIFAYAGLLPWTFFANAVTNSGASLTGNSNLISKVYFPRVIVPAAAVGAGFVDFVVAFGLLIGLMVWYAVVPTLSILLLPVLVALSLVSAFGVGVFMAALNVKYRDIRYALPFVIQVWMFATPIIYPLSLVPEQWRWLMALNPMAGIVEGYRSALLGTPVDAVSIGVSGIVSVVVAVAAMAYFKRTEKTFADIV